jgi:hypothetical protein
MPLATADTIALISNTVGISRSVDSLILTQEGLNRVRANARLNSGNTLTLQRGRLGFDVESPFQLRPFVHHFCAGGDTNCVPSTRFAAGAPKPTAIPESGTLTLLGTALLAVGGMVRRRFQWAVFSRRDIGPGSKLLATRSRALPFASFHPIAREVELRVEGGESDDAQLVSGSLDSISTYKHRVRLRE